MMDPELIKTFGQVAGIGGLALGVFLLIAKELVRKAIFPALTKQQSTRIILILAFMAWTTALAGIGAWTYVTVNPPLVNGQNKSFPITKSDKKVVKDVLSYLQIQLTLLNGIYDLFSKGLNDADQYNKHPTPSGYKTLKSSIQFRQKEMHDLLEHNHPLSDTLREELTHTPLSVPDLAVLYDYVNHDVRELSDRLAFLLVLLDPEMPFTKITQDKWLTITREGQKQGVLSLSYAVCEFLLPINHRELRDFRKEFLPGLTSFESDAFDFSLDETQLQQLQIAAQRKREVLGAEMASLVGGMRFKAEVFEARLQEIKEEFQGLLNNDVPHEKRTQ